MDDSADRMEKFSQVWSRAAPTYSQKGPAFFQYFGKDLADFAGFYEGAKVLDVACGRGAILFPAAEKVGKSGEVIGIDFSEGMVAETSVELRSRGIVQARVMRMNAEQLEFPDASFDFVTCGFALFFFPHLQQALAGFHRVLKPGGKMVVSTWGRGDPRWGWIDDLMKKANPSAQSNHIEGPAFDKVEGMTDLLTRNGFIDVCVQPVEGNFLYSDEEEYWASLWSHGARAPLERLSPEQLTWARSFAAEKISAYIEPQGIPQWMEALLTRGAKPTAPK